jgi:CRISPR-associated protein Cas2
MNRRERLYLISYDICDPRRLSRVARFLEKHACRVQYSVFVLQTTPAQLTLLLDGLAELIEPTEDDIRAYPLPFEANIDLLGRQIFPDDILLIRNGRNVLRLNERRQPAQISLPLD